MAYTKSRADWVDGEAGGTRIDAANLDTIEQGIYDAAANADAALAALAAQTTEGVQDVVGAMVVAAGGTYDDAAGTITLPTGGGGTGAVDSVNGQTGVVVLDAADVGADPAGTAAALSVGGLPRGLSAFTAALANVDVEPVRLLFVGDSLTHDGIQDVTLAIWPGHLIKRLTHTYQPGTSPAALVENRATMTAAPASGIVGWNISKPAVASAAYVQQADVDIAAIMQPRVIFHCVGTNDRLGSFSVVNAANNVRAAITALDAVIDPKPVHVLHWFGSLYQDKPWLVDELVARFVTIASEDPARRVALDLGPYADTLGVNDNISGAGDPYGLDGGDGIHLSAKGYRMWGELVFRAVTAAPALNVLGWSAAAPVVADLTAPAWTATITLGTPTQTTVTATASALATDAVGVTGYEVSYNGGTNYTTITPSGSVFTLAGAAGTTYSTTKLRAFDAAGNRSTPALDVPSYTMASPAGDTTAPTPGTLAGSAISDTGFTLTVTGASDAGSGLHATPYAFSTDNGTTWSAYQTSNVYTVTGKTQGTVYQCQHKVRDAATTPNEATGTAITVTTSSPAATSYTYLGTTYVEATGQGSRTFATQPLGTAASNRTIIVAVSVRAGTSITGVTVAGVTATLQAAGPWDALVGSAIYTAAVPAGTTGSVTVTTAANSEYVRIGLWAAYGTLAKSVSGTTADGAANVTLTAPANCLTIAAFAGFNGTPTAFSGATTDYWVNGYLLAGGGSAQPSAGSHSVSVPGSLNNYSSLVVVDFTLT